SIVEPKPNEANACFIELGVKLADQTCSSSLNKRSVRYELTARQIGGIASSEITIKPHHGCSGQTAHSKACVVGRKCSRIMAQPKKVTSLIQTESRTDVAVNYSVDWSAVMDCAFG